MDYLEAYAREARYWQDRIRAVGWARAKGQLKRDIRAAVAMGCDNCSGAIDAMLDAVGC